MPGCSTREPQRRHSTAFRFRPSSDTSSLGGSGASMAATPALGGDAQLGAASSHRAGAVPAALARRRRGLPALDATAQARASPARWLGSVRLCDRCVLGRDGTLLGLTWPLGLPHTGWKLGRSGCALRLGSGGDVPVSEQISAAVASARHLPSAAETGVWKLQMLLSVRVALTTHCGARLGVEALPYGGTVGRATFRGPGSRHSLQPLLWVVPVSHSPRLVLRRLAYWL